MKYIFTLCLFFNFAHACQCQFTDRNVLLNSAQIVINAEATGFIVKKASIANFPDMKEVDFSVISVEKSLNNKNIGETLKAVTADSAKNCGVDILVGRKYQLLLDVNDFIDSGSAQISVCDGSRMLN